MRLTTSFFAALMTAAFAIPAVAQLNIQTSSTSDLDALPVGQPFTIEITLTTPAPEAQGLTLRVAEIDDTVIAFDSATFANAGVFGAADGGSIFGTLEEIAPGFFAYSDGIDSILADAVDNGTNVVLFDGVSTGTPNGAGPDVFTITFDALQEGTMELEIGAVESFGDAFVSRVNGTTFPTTLLSVTVPEPGSAAASLAALGSVMGVVGIRRRRND
ncbi:MAG: hypothetical protein NXI30_16730 [bacterium]|nr:hypothetical protein [bacterium]